MPCRLRSCPGAGGAEQPLADSDPDCAEQIARSIADQYCQADALLGIGMSLTETNPGRSRRLLADAEALACDITDQWGMVHLLGRIAHALVAIDPDRSHTILIYAAPIARGISDPDLLRDIAETLADTEPNRAEEIARSITDDPYSQVAALRRVAKALAHTDPDRGRQVLLFAAQVARSFANPDHRDIELSQIA